MDKKRLLSIGQLSKITGVNIKSLRYYDRIGVLKPAYVDPESGYRYYTFLQSYLVDAVRFCVELDIPLKKFQNFQPDGENQIDYGKLVDYGRDISHKKIRSIQRKLEYLEEIQQQMDRAEELLGSNTAIAYEMPEVAYWTVPYTGKLYQGEYYSLVRKAYLDIREIGLRAGYETGLLSFCEGSKTERFLFVELEKSGQEPPKESAPILHLPAAPYLCRRAETGDLLEAKTAFPDLFRREYRKTVITAELAARLYDPDVPLFEIRCSLPGREL